MTKLLDRPRARLAPLALVAALLAFFAFTATSGAQSAPARFISGSGASPASLIPDPAPSGSQPFAVLLCRFAGSDPAQDPRPASYVQDMLRSTRPGLDHYWREVSYNKINLEGSKVFDWKTMSITHESGKALGSFKVGHACIAAHDASVDFRPYRGIVVAWDRSINNGQHRASGGQEKLTLDGKEQLWRMVWADATGLDQATIAHEMGHSFGLPHSSGPYSETYDSHWDLMSGGFDQFEDGREVRSEFPFGNVGVHPIAYHKDALKWIPADRKFTLDPGKRAIVTLARIAQPGSTGELIAQIPIQGSSQKFYTVELRQNLERFDSNRNFKVSYDDGSPAPPGGSVVIHKVDVSLGDRNAKVVDADNNGDPNDNGARWQSGETFTDPANGITIQVNSINRDAGTAVVTLDNRPSISIGDVTVSEPSAPNSTRQASFTVSLSNASNQSIGLDYFTTAGTATKDLDYVHVAGNHLSIPAGAKTATITINVKIDTLAEPNETFFVNLKNPIGATIADAQAKGTILNTSSVTPPPTPIPCPAPATNCQID